MIVSKSLFVGRGGWPANRRYDYHYIGAIDPDEPDRGLAIMERALELVANGWEMAPPSIRRRADSVGVVGVVILRKRRVQRITLRESQRRLRIRDAMLEAGWRGYCVGIRQ